jgi:hypothetical protein
MARALRADADGEVVGGAGRYGDGGVKGGLGWERTS